MRKSREPESERQSVSNFVSGDYITQIE